jgi:hypothetical protein
MPVAFDGYFREAASLIASTTATALIRAGNGIEVVADVLAHASLDASKHYVITAG